MNKAILPIRNFIHPDFSEPDLCETEYGEQVHSGKLYIYMAKPEFREHAHSGKL